MSAEAIFLALGIAVLLFTLWALGRHDLLRLIRPTRRVLAEVTGHRSSWEDGNHTYAPIYRFRDEAGEHEVTDMVYTTVARPEVGTRIELAYPEGRPELARPPRPLTWITVYLFLAYGLAVLGGLALGWIGD